MTDFILFCEGQAAKPEVANALSKIEGVKVRPCWQRACGDWDAFALCTHSFLLKPQAREEKRGKSVKRGMLRGGLRIGCEGIDMMKAAAAL